MGSHIGAILKFAIPHSIFECRLAWLTLSAPPRGRPSERRRLRG